MSEALSRGVTAAAVPFDARLPVVNDDKIRIALPEADRSVFADDVWQVYPFASKAVVKQRTISFVACPDGFRDVIKEVVWCLMNLETPQGELTRTTSLRSRVSLGTVVATYVELRMFARWCSDAGCVTPAAVSEETLRRFAAHVQASDISRNVKQRRLFSVTRLWLLSPYLPLTHRIPMPPWEQDGLDDILGPARWSAENKTVPVHPMTMSPLLVWALRWVESLAPDVLAAITERRGLVEAGGGAVQPGDWDKVHAYYQSVRATGGALPGFVDRQSRLCLAKQFIAGSLGVPTTIVGRRDCADLPIEAAAPLDIAVTSEVGQVLWPDSIDHYQAEHLGRLLATACLIVVTYLSGMRPEEVRSLERGCCHRQDRGGAQRYEVHGRVFKGALDEHGNTIPEGVWRDPPWTVIRPVATAVEVMESLHDADLLFPNGAFLTKTQRRYDRSVHLRTVSDAVAELIGWCNEAAARIGRPHEHIADDPDGAVTLRRLRRTLAWFIYRQPTGRIALGIQYGHLRGHVTDGYGSRVSASIRDVFPVEEAFVAAETLQTAAERIEAGEHVSGPARDRYLAAAAEHATTYQGSYLTEKQAATLQRNQHLRIYDNGEQPLACCYDATKALCHPENERSPDVAVSPDLTRCVTGCANGARTDSHVRRLREEQAWHQQQADAPATPEPLRQRHLQRAASLQQLVADHEATRRPAATPCGNEHLQHRHEEGDPDSTLKHAQKPVRPQ